LNSNGIIVGLRYFVALNKLTQPTL